MRPITTVRVAMMVLWLAMMVIDWDIIWMCLFCVTAVDIYDSIDRMDWQGKTREQIQFSNKIAVLSMLSLVLLSVIGFILELFL